MRDRWSQFSALTPAQREAFWLALVALPVVVLARPWLKAWVRRCAEHPFDAERPHNPDSAEMAGPRSLGHAVNAAARHGLVQASCLERSLVLVWLLRRRGFAGRLRLGARLLNARLDAHAWVEYKGYPINDRSDIAETYLPFEGCHPMHPCTQVDYSYMIERNRFANSEASPVNVEDRLT